MSRVAKKPISVPKGVEIKLENNVVSIAGPKGTLSTLLNSDIALEQQSGSLALSVRDSRAWAIAGTTRALLNNMVSGVAQGFSKRLQLVGVGYRAKVTGDVLNLSLGYSHPIDYKLPEGITAEVPSQTEIVLSGIDKRLLGQVAAEIRAFRPPEPYKGKGVRYFNEQIHRKEAKKK
ncbi:MAG TPA: 50S ribosomal protein L6 [Pseudomonadales bacterium]|jgi:large subunit ribosomal protein L6|nr:50S ribosomal protein L6 [Pseudomonadales bacterium]HNI72085.1 50S ribosomal protein L6 [Accumulibacter sp.]HMW13926.1 50S ribosomal protein L6 [Pseudomonadales bacterium]HMZ71523.1 50S ribosomal protein L6 [Pseudomonadales bacterium]HND26575.1 50S ribosomal protein L6 [Pseudomonadales bacterium]